MLYVDGISCLVKFPIKENFQTKAGFFFKGIWKILCHLKNDNISYKILISLKFQNSYKHNN